MGSQAPESRCPHQAVAPHFLHQRDPAPSWAGVGRMKSWLAPEVFHLSACWSHQHPCKRKGAVKGRGARNHETRKERNRENMVRGWVPVLHIPGLLRIAPATLEFPRWGTLHPGVSCLGTSPCCNLRRWRSLGSVVRRTPWCPPRARTGGGPLLIGRFRRRGSSGGRLGGSPSRLLQWGVGYIRPVRPPQLPLL